MKRKPTWAEIGSITDTLSEPSDERDIDDMAFALRSLLRRCRVAREDRKRFVALLNIVCRMQPIEFDDPGIADGWTKHLTSALSTFAPPHAWFGERAGEWGFWPIVDDDELPKLDKRHAPMAGLGNPLDGFAHE